MLNGATGKRFYYFMSSAFRFLGFVALLIAYIIVKIAVNPAIELLNILLITLSIGGLVSGIFNLILCGMPATGYKLNKLSQILCLIVTILTGGIVGTAFTTIAFAMKVTDEEVENEKITKVRK